MANMASATGELVKLAKGKDNAPPVIDYDELAAAIAKVKQVIRFKGDICCPFTSLVSYYVCVCGQYIYNKLPDKLIGILKGY